MFKVITPEQAGVPSKKVSEYIRTLERHGLATHGLLMLRGDRIFTEAYWKPFDADFCHRMYSETKSFVGIAIGLLIDDGVLSLDDKICELFADKIDRVQPIQMRSLTVRHLLTMRTAGHPRWWFGAGDPDRVNLYFEERSSYREPNTLWEYDSAGSQVLSALVERLAGKPLLEFLNERLFSHMGTFKTAKILKTPNGDSWGDSAMLCTLRDMASFGRLLMKGGNWNGEQLISESYVREATSRVVDNREYTRSEARALSHGYGYQIWKIARDGFAFVGMGDQLTLCLPEKELMLVITSDNQGNPFARETIVNSFFDIIVDSASEPLPENDADRHELDALTDGLELYCVKGCDISSLAKKISDKTYACADNPMGIKRFCFVFDRDGGEFRYTNAQGDKVIPFGVNRNVFAPFPQLGYSNEVGGQRTSDGFKYRAAASVCLLQENKLMLKVQIIDSYFGNLSAIFGFSGECAECVFEKTAEDFLDEYEGKMSAVEE